jgi:hypothetical protein
LSIASWNSRSGSLFGPALALQRVHGGVDDAFGSALLAVIHQHVHETAEDDIAELRIRQDFALFRAVTT